MDTTTVYELIGYAASVLVAVGLMMTSVLRLRILSLTGSFVFIVYAVLIDAIPIVVTNVFIAGINIYFIRKLLRRHDTFSLLEVGAESAYLLEFLSFHADDIAAFMPEFVYEPRDGQLRVFVLRDLVPAGLLVGDVVGDTLHIDLDYATKGYRDLQIARFLFGPQVHIFVDNGIRRLVTDAGTPAHEAYLQRTGYEAVDGRYVRAL